MTRSPDSNPPPADPKNDSFAARLKKKHGEGVDPEVSLDHDAAGATSGATNELLSRLADHGLKETRYKIQGEIARGGMGAILKVWDEDLRRTLAMKVILGRAGPAAESATTPVDPRMLGRFLEEAQVTGQLDHPGIAPVHELGLDSDGRVYFTMKLVKGRDLKHIFDLVFEGKEGWNETRALSVMLKVCEAMAYAHTKGVIHRDLKPANVMVGSFGEVYVMDWGLARVLGRKDTHDIRLKPEFGSSLRSVKTERREEREEAPDSPLVTMDGDVMGTPAYMPPEQALGEIERLSPRSDVYAIGSMLYHLLARQMPYVKPAARVSNRTVLAMVLQGPPAPLASLRKDVPAELVAICEKAMAREPESRYADTLALAEDLRAYFEHRVVGAYETGAWAESKKWVERNKPLAAALAAGVLALIAGLFVSLSLKRSADENALEAERQEGIAKANLDAVLSLSAIQDLRDLVRQADELWPAHPGNVAKYESWLEEARTLAEGRPGKDDLGTKARPGLPEHRRKLAELEARALPSVDSEASLGDEREFAEREDRWWHAQLSKLVADLEAFTDPEAGVYSSAITQEHGWGVQRRLDFARTVEEKSLTGAEARDRWAVAIASIRDRTQCPKYDGLAITPQLGLLPIGRDRESGLWEFADVATGAAAVRGEDGRLVLEESTGLVFVLVPAGTFTLGAQSTDPTEENYDRAAGADESPVARVTLLPFLLSKYEMTQAQWQRVTGRNPSLYGPHNYASNWNAAGRTVDLLHPVEQVSWEDCAGALARLGMTLPTEAQWEYACRARTTGVYWSGDEVESLQGVANVSDEYGKTHGNDRYPEWEESLNDGQTVHAAVGTYRGNPFGLHDMHGNVWEWCLDGYGEYALPVREGDGEREVANPRTRVFRGGSFAGSAAYARSSVRRVDIPGRRGSGVGVRPAIVLEAR